LSSAFDWPGDNNVKKKGEMRRKVGEKSKIIPKGKMSSGTGKGVGYEIKPRYVRNAESEGKKKLIKKWEGTAPPHKIPERGGDISPKGVRACVPRKTASEQKTQ